VLVCLLITDVDNHVMVDWCVIMMRWCILGYECNERYLCVNFNGGALR